MEPEIKSLIEEIGREHKQLQDTLKQKAEEAAKGAVDPLIEVRLKALNEAITEKEAKRDRAIDEMRSRLDVLAQFGGERDEKGRRLTPEQKAYQGALNTYMRKGVDGGLRELEAKAMSVGSDPDGGYTVESDRSGRIVTRVFDTSPMRGEASIVTIGTDSLEGMVDRDEASASWVGETGTRSDTSTPAIGKWSIPVHEMYANPKATQKLLDDSNVDIEAWLAGKVADKFARVQNTAFVTGNGIGRPRGFASYTTAATADATRTWGVFEHVASGTSGGFGSDPTGLTKLVTVSEKLHPTFRGNAKWYMNRTTVAAVRLLTDTSSQGKYVFIPDFSGNTAGSILGKPIVLLEDMDSYSTASALGIAYGDMRETYTIVDRLGIRVLRDPFTAKPYVCFYTTARVGGDVLNFDALKFLKFATT